MFLFAKIKVLHNAYCYYYILFYTHFILINYNTFLLDRQL